MPSGVYDRTQPKKEGKWSKNGGEQTRLVKPGSEESPNKQEMGDDQGCVIL